MKWPARTIRCIKRAFEFYVYLYLFVFASLFIFILTLNDLVGAYFGSPLSRISFVASLVFLIFLIVIAVLPFLLMLIRSYLIRQDSRREGTEQRKSALRWHFDRLWESYTYGMKQNNLAR